MLIRVAAAAVNRPDVQQRRGLYPPPPGASVVLGLDVAGVIDRVAPDVDWPRPGEAVCALANGGGYAEFCSVPAVQCMPIPKGFDFVAAAALPEAFFTAWNSMVWLGRLDHGETLLVQGGTTGVGMAAIQIARGLRDARVLATAGSEEKCRICLEHGARQAIDYRTADWPDEVRRRPTAAASTSFSTARPAPIPARARPADARRPGGAAGEPSRRHRRDQCPQHRLGVA